MKNKKTPLFLRLNTLMRKGDCLNRMEMFKRLHEVFTGEKHKQHSTIAEYEKLTAEEGLAKAEAYLDSAKKGQDNCRSDWSYWAWEGDITLAKILVSIFKAFKSVITEFPEIPDLEGKVLMDKASYLQDWAYKLNH